MPDHSDPNSVLTIKVRDGLQQRDDGWVFFSDEFRSFSYGDTEQEATGAFFNTLRHVTKLFKSREELKSFLDSRGVYYRFDDGEESTAFRDVEVSLPPSGA